MKRILFSWILGDPVTDVLLAVVVLVAGQLARTDLRVRHAARVAEQAKQIALSTCVQLDVHGRALSRLAAEARASGGGDR
jgi:hypothetical protein